MRSSIFASRAVLAGSFALAVGISSGCSGGGGGGVVSNRALAASPTPTPTMSPTPTPTPTPPPTPTPTPTATPGPKGPVGAGVYDFIQVNVVSRLNNVFGLGVPWSNYLNITDGTFSFGLKLSKISEVDKNGGVSTEIINNFSDKVPPASASGNFPGCTPGKADSFIPCYVKTIDAMAVSANIHIPMYYIADEPDGKNNLIPPAQVEHLAQLVHQGDPHAQTFVVLAGVSPFPNGTAQVRSGVAGYISGCPDVDIWGYDNYPIGDPNPNTGFDSVGYAHVGQVAQGIELAMQDAGINKPLWYVTQFFTRPPNNIIGTMTPVSNRFPTLTDLKGMASAYLANVPAGSSRQVFLWRLGAFGTDDDPIGDSSKTTEMNDFNVWLAGQP